MATHLFKFIAGPIVLSLSIGLEETGSIDNSLTTEYRRYGRRNG